jgi:coumaroylquinate(coumaroylshikimate) 3'-monooxygenase
MLVCVVLWVFMMVIHDYRERATTKAPGAPELDLVDILVNIKDEVDKPHDREIVWLISEQILANTDIVATIVEWTLANLMANPRVQDKVHEEIDRVCGRKPSLYVSSYSISTFITTKV